MTDSKIIYADFCKQNKGIPLFCRAEWLDAAVGPDGWNCTIAVSDQGKTLAVFAYTLWQKSFSKFISDTVFVPYLHPLLSPTGLRPAGERIKHERLTAELLLKTGTHFQYRIPLYPHLPVHIPAWTLSRFKLLTKYTHIIDKQLQPVPQDHYKETVRREIKKAEKNITVRPAGSAANALKLLRLNNRNNNLTENNAERMLNACRTHRFGELLEAVETATGKVISFIWLAMDRENKITYYLLGATHPEYKTSGASSLLINTSLNNYTPENGIFNFMGSSIASIHRFFSGFGTRVIPVVVAGRLHGWPRLAFKIKELLKF